MPPYPCLRCAFVALVLASASLGCSSQCPSSSGSDQQLILTGASTIAPLIGDIAKRFESDHPGVRIDVQTGGSSRGIADVRNRLSTIGMISRSQKDDEHDLHFFLMAKDGVGIILNSANSVGELTDQEIVDIYTGKITNWKDVGGADAEIIVVNKAAGRSTLELFLKHFDLTEDQIDADIVIGDNEQGIKTVAGNPNSIGYVSIGAAEYQAEHGIPIKLLPLDSVVASVDNVRNGSFPLARELNLVTREAPAGVTREFIEFARSDKVHDLIEDYYFVPLAAQQNDSEEDRAP